MIQVTWYTLTHRNSPVILPSAFLCGIASTRNTRDIGGSRCITSKDFFFSEHFHLLKLHLRPKIEPHRTLILPLSHSLQKMFYSSRASRSSESLISFYNGTGTDPRGRYLKDILKWDADQLEVSHDYIQILFPLPEESGVNWNAPIINKEVFDAFRGSDELKNAMRGVFERMAWFYGFKIVRKENGELEVSVVQPSYNQIYRLLNVKSNFLER